MLARYKCIAYTITKVDVDDVFDLFPSSREEEKLEERFNLLPDLKRAMTRFQRDDITFGHVRSVSNEVV